MDCSDRGKEKATFSDVTDQVRSADPLLVEESGATRHQDFGYLK